MAENIIEALGGNKAVADALGVAPNVVANWRLEGRDIPWKRRHAIAELARARGVDLPGDFFGAAA